MGRVIVARRSGAVDGLGHVGWAYEQADGTWMCGATENPSGSIGGIGDVKGFWTEAYEATEVPRVFGLSRALPAGVCPPYDTYKSIDTLREDVSDAWSTAGWCRDQPFMVPCRDCLDDAFDVLTSYGAALPWPILAIPNLWFDLINAPVKPVPSADGRPARGMERTPAARSMPPWRSPMTAEGVELYRLQGKYAYLRDCAPDKHRVPGQQ
jgi:hypothetical protein